MSEEDKIQIGILGCGWIMQKVYSPILRTMGDRVNVIAICDINAKNAEAVHAFFTNATVFYEPTQLVASAKLDAVMVLTSELANAKMAELALRSGLSVYLEKPPAISTAQLESLLRIESGVSAKLFCAFNRRHTPLLNRLKLEPGTLRRVHGRMERIGRSVHGFPYTAVHLIDSAQYFGGGAFISAGISFDSGPETRWTVSGFLANGATCELEFNPNGSSHCEYLIFEGNGYTIEIQFPNPEGRFPYGKLVHNNVGSINQTIAPDAGEPLEEMGYAPCFRGFVDELNSDHPLSAIYRLSSCQASISIMEAMVRRENVSILPAKAVPSI